MRHTEILQQVNDAIGAHGMWKLRLRTTINTGRSDIRSSEACRDDKCTFGRWLHGTELDAQTRAGMPYNVIKRLHAEFHKCAGDVLLNVEKGNMAAAITLLDGEYTERTEKLSRALTKWKRELTQSAAMACRAA